MRINDRLRSGMLILLGAGMTAAFGAFTSFAYDSASFTTCSVENGNSIVVTGKAQIDTRPQDERFTAVVVEPGPGSELPANAVLDPKLPNKETATVQAEVPAAGAQKAAEGDTDAAANTPVVAYVPELADDGNYYLFALQPYETEIGSRTDYIASCPRTEELRFELPFSWSPDDALLYSRFILALKTADGFLPISSAVHVTNPGDIAAYFEDYPDAMSKKGLLIQLDMLGDAMDLGVKHTIVNMAYHDLFGGNLKYRYNGKDYYFNEEVLKSYDKMISSFSGRGIIVSAILLNGWTDKYPELREPGVTKTANAAYYGFNVSTEEGYNSTRALFSFLAERYSGAHDEYGRVSNWIIGNEVNHQFWNYVGPMEIGPYVKKFERVFRVAYTAIKSRNKNARVFFSTDFLWSKPNSQLEYSARDFLDIFNAGIRSEGNIDWSLAYHPYPYPPTEPEFWDDYETGELNDTENSPIVSLINMHILTDHLCRPEFLTASGEVRHIIFSEQGFTSNSATRGYVYDNQAAAFAYAYYLVDANPYIDAFIISRQVDSLDETKAGCYFGIWTVDESSPRQVIAVMPKNIHTVFKYIDTKNSLKYTEFAKEIIGISKWSDVIPNFKLSE